MLIEAKKGRAIEIRKTILRYGVDEFVNGKYLINARELNSVLGVGCDFSIRIKDRIDTYGFREGYDYTSSQSPNRGSGGGIHTGGSPSIKYFLSMSMAKELAIVENNDRGREVRKYLIRVEDAWNTPEKILVRAQEAAQEIIERQRQKIASLEQKAEYAEAIDSTGAVVKKRI